MCTQQRQDQDWTLTTKFYQAFTCKEEKASLLLYQFHKIGRERTLPNSFYDSSVTLASKPDTPYTEGEEQTGHQTPSLRYKNSQ